MEWIAKRIRHLRLWWMLRKYSGGVNTFHLETSHEGKRVIYVLVGKITEIKQVEG